MTSFVGYLLCVSLVCSVHQSIGTSIPKDYFKVMGLSRKATTSEVKEAFKRLAIKYHPDKNESPEQFYEIQRAFEVLSDPIKRGMYIIKLGLGELRRAQPIGPAQARPIGPAVLPAQSGLRIIHEVLPDSQPEFDSNNVITGFYISADQVAGFQAPSRLLHPWEDVQVRKEGWPENDGSITCSTCEAEDDDSLAQVKHTQCR